jgi:hypothetical protein
VRYDISLSPKGSQASTNTNKNDSSLQLVFGEMLGNHFWWLFQGPLGIGVDMCGLDEQFELVKLWPHPGTANIDSPPFPTKVSATFPTIVSAIM